MTQNTKEWFKIVFSILACIGLMDMGVQASTDGEVELIQSFLEWIFG